MAESIKDKTNGLSTWAKILLVVLPMTFGAGGAWAVFTWRLSAMEKSLDQFESKRVADHDSIMDMRGDIKVIKDTQVRREELEKQLIEILKKQNAKKG